MRTLRPRVCSLRFLRRLRRTIGVVVCLTAGMLLVPAGAAEPNPPRPALPPTERSEDGTQIHTMPTMLLREGSVATQVRGRLEHDEETSRWRFRIDADHPDFSRFTLQLLPNLYLGEMRQVYENANDQEVIFEVTGEVTVYDRENYLLVQTPPRVVAQAARTDDEADDDDRAADRQRTAADRMREMRERGGETARRPDVETTSIGHDDRLVPEGTIILQRRARMSRGTGGSWRVVFEADASGEADPPMTLLPCLLLEQLEVRARRTGGREPILISGRVTVHRGRNYLLPTSYHLPRNRTELMP